MLFINNETARDMNYYIKIINPAQAQTLYKSGTTEIYKCFDDDAEALVQSEHDLNDAIDLSINLGIKVKLLNRAK